MARYKKTKKKTLAKGKPGEWRAYGTTPKRVGSLNQMRKKTRKQATRNRVFIDF